MNTASSKKSRAFTSVSLFFLESLNKNWNMSELSFFVCFVFVLFCLFVLLCFLFLFLLLLFWEGFFVFSVKNKILCLRGNIRSLLAYM